MGVSVGRPLASIETAYFGKLISTTIFFSFIYFIFIICINLFLILLILCSNSMTSFFRNSSIKFTFPICSFACPTLISSSVIWYLTRFLRWNEAILFACIGQVDNLPIDVLLDVTSWCPHPPVCRVENLPNTCENVWWESLVQSVVCLTECMLRSLLKGLLLTLLSSSCVCPYVYIRYCGAIQLHVVGQDLSPVLRV